MQECRFTWLLQSHELVTEEVHGLLQSAQFGAVILVRGEKTLAELWFCSTGPPAKAHGTSFTPYIGSWRSLHVNQDGLVNSTENMLTMVAPMQDRTEVLTQ